MTTPEMRTWTFPEVHDELPAEGPWTDEPDKAQWIDKATGLDCLVVRAGVSGSLCGYVGVPPGHPLHGVDYGEPDIRVHGGLTFSSTCQEGAEDGPGVCHVPEPGRPTHVWWFGFDCAHAGDAMPRVNGVLAEKGHDMTHRNQDVYRTFEYVREEIEALAEQLHRLGASVPQR